MTSSSSHRGEQLAFRCLPAPGDGRCLGSARRNDVRARLDRVVQVSNYPLTCLHLFENDAAATGAITSLRPPPRTELILRIFLCMTTSFAKLASPSLSTSFITNAVAIGVSTSLPPPPRTEQMLQASCNVKLGPLLSSLAHDQDLIVSRAEHASRSACSGKLLTCQQLFGSTYLSGNVTCSVETCTDSGKSIAWKSGDTGSSLGKGGRERERLQFFVTKRMCRSDMIIPYLSLFQEFHIIPAGSRSGAI